MEKLDAILTAVTGACEGESDGLVVNLDTFEALLLDAGIGVKVLNRAALLAELKHVREEQRVQRTRAQNSDGAAEGEAADLLAQLEARERDITQTLWPS